MSCSCRTNATDTTAFAVQAKVELDDAEDTSERDNDELVRDRGWGSSNEEKVKGFSIVLGVERASLEVGKYSDDSEPLLML